LIERVVGTGGMGVVYAATHRLTHEQVAVKFLREKDLHVWSMAVVVYRALSGVGPFVRKNVAMTMIDVATASYPPLDVTVPELPQAAELQAVIGRALARDPALRTASMLAFMTELAQVAGVDPAAILGRFGLEWPHVSLASSAPLPANESSSDASSSQPPSHVSRKRTSKLPARGDQHVRRKRRALVSLLLLAAICAAWGAFAAFRNEPAPRPAPAPQQP
jgi:serine/threonine protein kinase